MGLVAPDDDLLHGSGSQNEIVNGGDRTNSLASAFSEKDVLIAFGTTDVKR